MTRAGHTPKQKWAFPRSEGGCPLGSVILACSIAVTSCTPRQVQYSALESLPPARQRAESSLFLVGDAGEANPGRDAVLAHLRTEVEAAAAAGTPVVVAYLGDNIYDVGAREAFADEDLSQLRAQIQPLGRNGNVRGVFVPGNHDWAKGASTAVARAAIRLQGEWLEQLADGRDVALRPGDGCPGPSTLELDESTHLIFIDSEWLIRNPRDACGSAADFYERLRADLARNKDRRIVVMAHHPMVTGGLHGGHVALLYHGPLVHYLATKSGVIVQDLASGAYSEMLERLAATIDASGARPLVYAAGHDHNLQVIRTEGAGRPTFQLVSGSGAKTSNARRLDGTRYATNHNGYMRLDFSASDVRLVVYAQASNGSAVRPVFTCSLTSVPAEFACPEAPLVGSRR